MPSTGIHWLDTALLIVGALYAVLTALASVLPKHDKVTQALARVGGDIRGIRKPSPPQATQPPAPALLALPTPPDEPGTDPSIPSPAAIPDEAKTDVEG